MPFLLELIGLVLFLSAAVWLLLDLTGFLHATTNVWVRRAVVVAVLPFCLALTVAGFVWELVETRDFEQAYSLFGELWAGVTETWAEDI